MFHFAHGDLLNWQHLMCERWWARTTNVSSSYTGDLKSRRVTANRFAYKASVLSSFPLTFPFNPSANFLLLLFEEPEAMASDLVDVNMAFSDKAHAATLDWISVDSPLYRMGHGGWRNANNCRSDWCSWFKISAYAPTGCSPDAIYQKLHQLLRRSNRA